MTPIKPAHRAMCMFTAVLFPFAGTWSAFGQAAPTPASSSATDAGQKTDDQTIVLSPFTVNTDKDVGFVAANSLAGGRLAGALAETPVAYSVQTREFLDALNLGDLNEAINWTVNATTTPDDGGGQLFGGTGTSTIRGVGSNAQTRDFFVGGANPDTYNLDRIDYARGPNSILFGTGTISGTANAVLKTGMLNRDLTQLRFQYGSWGSFRSQLDVNRPLGRKVAVRVNVLKDDANNWRDWVRTNKKGFSPAVTFDITKTTRLYVGSEYYEQQAVAGMNALVDNFAGWDGVSVYSGLQPSTVSTTGKGVARIGSNTLVWSGGAGEPANTVMNYNGLMQTQGFSGQHAVNGVTTLSTSNLGYSGVAILDEPSTPAGLYDLAAQNSYFKMPRRSFTNIGPEPTSINRLRDASFRLEQRVGAPLTLQLAGDYNRRSNYGLIDWYTNQTYPNVYIDINKQLPDGSPNPNFLEPYNEFNRQERTRSQIKNKGLRLAAAFVKDTSWVDIKANVMAASEAQQTFQMREYFMLPYDPDSREWGLISSSGRTRTIRYRYYWNQPDREIPNFPQVNVVDPTTGTTTTYHPLWVLASDRADATVLNRSYDDYYQASGTLSFFKKHLILLGAFRSDSIDRSQKQFLAAMDEPVGTVLTPSTFLYRPNAPADYQTLTYVPKDATGKPTGGATLATVRPRDSSGIALPQYANDRFQNDYNPPASKTKKPTKEIGGIVSLGYGFSVWANYSQTFNPATLGSVTIDYNSPDPSFSTGKDYGIRYSLGPKFYASLSRYEANESNVAVSHPSGYSDIITIIGTPPITDPNTNDSNARGVGTLPQTYQDEIDRKSKGYEFEMVANLTRNWRVTANYSLADAVQVNAYRLTRAYLVRNDTVLRQILSDAGIAIDSNNVAALKPGVTVPSTNTTSVNNAINAWNDLQANEANWVTGPQKLNRLTKYTANFFTDYRFTDSRLRGLRLGFGMQFRGPQVIGYRGADTIVDPNNPTKAIDDPTVDAYSTVWQKAYYLASATAGYSFKLAGGQKIDFNLSIANLVNYGAPLYNTSGLRPPNGDLSSPARISYARAYSYTVPRSFRFSTTVSF